ncbi:hypothetical protein EIP86_002148 [Pleurotus ostreatoroseus]|nr:hypothetical protein EIP86_002148 [Pleurotus ostreatoroseus]
MQPILITRFLIDLRRCSSAGDGADSGSAPRRSTINFCIQSAVVHGISSSFGGPSASRNAEGAWADKEGEEEPLEIIELPQGAQRAEFMDNADGVSRVSNNGLMV